MDKNEILEALTVANDVMMAFSDVRGKSEILYAGCVDRKKRLLEEVRDIHDSNIRFARLRSGCVRFDGVVDALRFVGLITEKQAQEYHCMDRLVAGAGTASDQIEKI